MSDGEAAVEEAANHIAKAIKNALDPLAIHMKELEEEVEYSESLVGELHAKLEHLEKRKFPDPQVIAGLIHDFFYARGRCPTHWKASDSEWRNDLIALSARLVGATDAV